MVSGAGGLRSGNTRLPAPGKRLVEAASPGAGLRPSGLGFPARPLPRGRKAATEPGGTGGTRGRAGPARPGGGRPGTRGGQRNGGAGVPAARGRAAGGFAGFVLVSGLLPAGRAPGARLGRSRPGMEAPVSPEVRMCSASEV